MNKKIKHLIITTAFILLASTTTTFIINDFESAKITKMINDDDDEKTHISIIAHRGFSSLEIENSIEAIKLGFEDNSTTGVEIDIHLTKDKQIVAIHDNSINNKNIKELYLNQLIINKSHYYTFNALNKKHNDVWYYKCPCGQGDTKCDLCGVCFNPNLTGKEYTIFVEYHGLKNAKGFKHLFTQQEIKGVMDKLKQNGWVTDDEFKQYRSKAQTQKLKDTSQHVISQRKASAKPKKQTPVKKTTKKKNISK